MKKYALLAIVLYLLYQFASSSLYNFFNADEIQTKGAPFSISIEKDYGYLVVAVKSKTNNLVINDMKINNGKCQYVDGQIIYTHFPLGPLHKGEKGTPAGYTDCKSISQVNVFSNKGNWQFFID